MQIQKNSQKIFVSYVLVLAGFFIIALITVPLYQNIIVESEARALQERELERESQRLQELQDIRVLMQSEDNEVVEKIEVLSKEFVEADIFAYLHEYTRSLASRRDMIVFRDMSFGTPQSTDLGFQSTTVNLSFVVSSEETLFNFMDFLTRDGGDYKFFIPSFSYELGELEGNFPVQLPLILYHR
ncbi:hypothetical protein LAT59_02825 [Candidatus Gracilibacteria bacterium]|nr:hypothetical protein [Candidatus Gracilibacteria bacterium]